MSREETHGGRRREALVVHDKVEDITAEAATKAVETATDETQRGRLFSVSEATDFAVTSNQRDAQLRKHFFPGKRPEFFEIGPGDVLFELLSGPPLPFFAA